MLGASSYFGAAHASRARLGRSSPRRKHRRVTWRPDWPPLHLTLRKATQLTEQKHPISERLKLLKAISAFVSRDVRSAYLLRFFNADERYERRVMKRPIIKYARP